MNVPPDQAAPSSPKYAPSLRSLQGKLCENCTVGVLYVTLYDPKSLHEQGQDLSAANQQAVSGRYETQCYACGQHLSHPLVASDDPQAAS